MRQIRQWLGSVLFTLYLFLSVPVYVIVALATWPFPHRVTYAVGRHWTKSVLFFLKVLCGLDYTVEGRENIPDENTVVLLKHSSAFEAIAQVRIFPKQTWVIKRELLWAPFLGWALPLFKPIAIDRKAGRDAVEQVLQQGRQRLAEGFWVMIFPEGTRVAAGETGRYGLSGALLATAAARPVIPVAHNAGEFWPRRGWLKKPGTIRMVIGPPIATAGREARDITTDVRDWIEAKVAEIGTPAPNARD